MNNIRFIFIILALLQLVGCQKAPKTGEAFIVLNSGDIQYMADMPVLGFNEKFAQDYETFKYNQQKQFDAYFSAQLKKPTSYDSEIKIGEETIVLLNKKISEQQIAAEKFVIEDKLDQYIKAKSVLEWRLSNYDASKAKTGILSTIIELNPTNARNIDLESLKEVTENIKHIHNKDTFYKDMVEKKFNELAETYLELFNKAVKVENEFKEYRLAEVYKNLAKKYDDEFYAFLVSKKIFEVHTTSTGKFKVPADVKYIFAARDAGSGEKLAWLQRVNEKAESIELTSSNRCKLSSDPLIFIKQGYELTEPKY